MVCLSVVCHIRAPCLNCSTVLDAIWHVRLRSPMTLVLDGGSLTPSGRGDLGVEPCSQNTQLQICCCHLADRNEEQFRLSLNHFGHLLYLYTDMIERCRSIWGRLQLVPCTSVFWRWASKCCSLWSIIVRLWTSLGSWLVSRFISWTTEDDGTIGLHSTWTFISNSRCRWSFAASNGRACGSMCRLSVCLSSVCNVMYCG